MTLPDRYSTWRRLGAGALPAGLLALVAAEVAAAPPSINPKQVPQFVETLPNPLHPDFIWQPDADTTDTYTLKIQEFTQQLGLGAGVPPTVVWGYGKDDKAPTFPGRTFELNQNDAVTVQYVNDLVDADGTPLPNRMPVDTSLEWADPGTVGGITPVPVVAHLHGGDSTELSDGGPEGWGTPDDQTGRLFSSPYYYDNSQEAGTLWYHDHALGITRTNVYMGLAGFYILRDANENDLRADNVLPKYPYEVPIVIQDRQIDNAGQLLYPVGKTPINSALPEFFGDIALVNGVAWPKLIVEPRKYRLRLLNGSDSRFYDLRLEYFKDPKDSKIAPGTGTQVPFYVIGTELGLLNQPAVPILDTPVKGARPNTPGVLPIGPGERYDVIVDFTNVPAGSRVVVTNTARSTYPDAARPSNKLLDRLMAFDVSGTPPTGDATVDLDTDLRTTDELPPAAPVPDGTLVRRILLFEGFDTFGRLMTMLGTVDQDPVTGQQGTLVYKDPITETPTVGTTEVWEFYNTTVDAHPIHMHLVNFRVLGRQTFTGVLTPKTNTDGSIGGVLDPATLQLTGPFIDPEAYESGRKDTVKVFPGEMTRVLVSFDREGEYVYHCHILSHEDHEMMRPYQVVAEQAAAVAAAQ